MRRALFAIVVFTASLPALAQFPFGFWKTVGAGATAGGAGGSNTRVLTYSSDGDTNGASYFAGKNYTSGGTWTNPHTAGYLTVVNTPLAASGSALSFVNRTLDHSVFTGNTVNSYAGIDLGAGRSLVPTYYSMRARDDDNTNLPRNWKLQGTNSVTADNDGAWIAATWTDLDTRTSNTTISVASAWGSFAVTGVSTGYRYLRIVQTGTNSSGNSYFCIQEIEFYGTLTY